MANKIVKYTEPILAGAILTAQLVDRDGTNLGSPVAITTEVNGVFRFTFSVAVNAGWYRMDLMEGSNDTASAWVEFPNGDVAGTYEATYLEPILFTSISSIDLSGDGQYAIVFQVRNSANDSAIANACISIFNEDNTLVATIYTDSSGNRTHNLSGGTYTYNVTATGYTSVSAAELQVTQAGEELIELDSVSVSNPSSPELCIVYCYFKLNGTAIEGAVLSANLEQANNTTQDTVLASLSKTTDTTDEEGYAELQLVKYSAFSNLTEEAGIYHITLTHNNNVHLNISVKIPDLESVDVVELVSLNIHNPLE